MVRPTRSRSKVEPVATAAANKEADVDELEQTISKLKLKDEEKVAEPIASAATTQPDAFDACVICLEDITGCYAGLDQCCHTFHEQCILDWARVTNLCPLCKTRFKHIKQINPNATAQPTRPGLRTKAAKTVRVATKNQVVTWSSSEDEDEEEEDEEERPAPRRTRTRTATGRRTTARAPITEVEAPTNTTRSRATRCSRRRRQSEEEEEEEEEEKQLEEDDDDDEEDEEYLPNSSDVEGDATPNFDEMNDEELLAYAMKESLKMSQQESPKATETTTRAKAPRRAAVTRTTTTRTRRRIAVSDNEERKENSMEDTAVEEVKPKRRGGRKRNEEKSAEPCTSSTGHIQWIRTRDGKWTRTRVTNTSSFLPPRPAPSSTRNNQDDSSFMVDDDEKNNSSSTSSETALALSQADDALMSFEQRILARQASAAEAFAKMEAEQLRLERELVEMAKKAEAEEEDEEEEKRNENLCDISQPGLFEAPSHEDLDDTHDFEDQNSDSPLNQSPVRQVIHDGENQENITPSPPLTPSLWNRMGTFLSNVASAITPIKSPAPVVGTPSKFQSTPSHPLPSQLRVPLGERSFN